MSNDSAENTAASRSANPLALIAVLGVLLIALAAAFLVGLRIHGSQDPSVRGIVTQGNGSVTATPDQIRFTASVTNRAPSTSAAMSATNRDITAVTNALKKAGVDAKDIQTAGFSVDPQFRYPHGVETITGYAASQDLTVLVRKLSDSGAVISAAAGAAGNRVSVGDIALAISNKTDLVAQARQRAVKDSKRAAQALADAAGRTIGKLVYVEEITSTPDEPVAYDSADAASATPAGGTTASPVPISAGSQKVTVRVKVRWSLK